jgi:hypothetical protein
MSFRKENELQSVDKVILYNANRNSVNYFGSSKSLLGNSTSAMLAAIEVYNKPQFSYRSECFVVLLVNAWELAFKALLSKHRKSIYKKKERGRKYETLGIRDCLEKVKPFFPADIAFRPVECNIRELVKYRNDCIHFYNEEGFGVLVYGLAQTSIVNYRDLVNYWFRVDIADKINISLLPLSFRVGPDPVEYIKRASSEAGVNEELCMYLKSITDTTQELESAGVDTGRFLTVFRVNLQSSKKIQTADITAKVGENDDSAATMITRVLDPNVSHPNLRKDIVGKDSKFGIVFNSYTFDALVRRYKLKENQTLCWKNSRTNTFQYSQELVNLMKQYSSSEIEEARRMYSSRTE